MDQQTLADRADVSLPTIQRMEASQGNVRGVVDTLVKVVRAFDAAGIEMIGENTPSHGSGRGVRFKVSAQRKAVVAPSPTGRRKKAVSRE